MNFSNKRIESPRKLGIGNKFLPSSRQERSGSGESDFLICCGKGKEKREKSAQAHVLILLGKGERGKGKVSTGTGFKFHVKSDRFLKDLDVAKN